MLRAETSGLKAGRNALTWALGQTDVWYLLYRCAHYVSKTHGTNDIETDGNTNTNISILDKFFAADEDIEEIDVNYRNYQHFDFEEG